MQGLLENITASFFLIFNNNHSSEPVKSFWFFTARKFTILLLSVLFLFVFSFTLSAREAARLSIENLEVYDLNGIYDFSASDDHSFRSPTTDTSTHSIQVPGQWHMIELPGNMEPADLSIVWYRKQLQISEHWHGENMSIRIPIIADAHEVYFNGEKIGGQGTIGEQADRAPAVKSNRPAVYRIPNHLIQYGDDSINILGLRVSDDIGWGGIVSGDLSIGPAEIIESQFQKQIIWNSAITFVFIFSGLYYLILYLGRKDDISYLFYGIFAILAGMAMAGYHSLYYWLYDSFWFNHFLYHIPLNIVSLFFVLFMQNFFAINHRIIRYIMFLTIPLTGLALLAPLHASTMHIYAFYGLTISNLLVIFSIPYVFFLIIQAMKEGKTGARTLLVGATFLLVSVLFAILGYLQVIDMMDRWVSEGLLIFTLSMAVALAFKFSKIYERTDQLAEELAEKNIELEKLDKLKDEFLANTSHELKTPMNGIIGITESLLEGAAGPVSHDMERNLRMVSTSGRRLLNLVQDILDVSQMKNSKLELHCIPVDIHTITDLVLSLSGPAADVKKIQLINSVDPGTKAVYADENRIQQILHNLVGNAIKFTDAGSVEVRAEQQENWLFIDVIDTGIGIPHDRMTTIFNAFEQVDGSDTRAAGGTGLGLAITKQLIELHNGNISVSSEPGKGSKFRFSLPLADEEVATDLETVSQISLRNAEETNMNEQEKPDRPGEIRDSEGPQFGKETVESAATIATVRPTDSRQSADASFHRTHRVLVVDDEPVNLQVLENNLKFGNFDVVTVDNGAAALEQIGKNDFDLVLLDVMMPGMSGYEVCAKIRIEQSANELPVILLTAKNQVTDLLNGFEAGANDYLTKPFSRKELMARVKTHMDLSSIHRSLARFVPYEFIETLGKTSINDVHLGDQTLKSMSVLFSDIRSFTSTLEILSPEESFELLNRYLQSMGPIIRGHGGFIDKFIGDAIMALFPRKADDALSCAIEMHHRLRMDNDIGHFGKISGLNIGIGIHSGNLMLGIIGEEERIEGTVIADAVNTAQRLEELTKRFRTGIIISKDFIDRLENPDEFIKRYIGKVQLRGRKQYSQLYEVISSDADEIRSLKENYLQDFEYAVGEFLEGNYSKAETIFANILKENPADGAASYYYEKIDTALKGAS